jgi:hypothetical protein
MVKKRRKWRLGRINSMAFMIWLKVRKTHSRRLGGLEGA